MMQTDRGDGVTSIKRRCRDLSSDGVEYLTTASGRNRLKSDLEDLTWRRTLIILAAFRPSLGPQNPIVTDLNPCFNQIPPRNTTFPFQRYTLMFQQYQDESIYDVWTRFKNVIQRVPHHGLNLLSLAQFFYDHADDYTRMDLDFVADGYLRELSSEEAWEAIENITQCQKEWDNPPNIISEQELANLKAQATRLFRNEKVWVELYMGISWDKVENPNP
ncbi:hypothetical protein Tco_0672932 [Tanacetum coccineum]